MREVKPVYKKGKNRANIVEIYPVFDKTSEITSTNLLDQLNENTIFCNMEKGTSISDSAKTKVVFDRTGVDDAEREKALQLYSESVSLLHYDIAGGVSLNEKEFPAPKLMLRGCELQTDCTLFYKDRKFFDLQKADVKVGSAGKTKRTDPKKVQTNDCKDTPELKVSIVTERVTSNEGTDNEQTVEDSILVQIKDIDALDIPELSAEQMKQNLLEKREEQEYQKKRIQNIECHRRVDLPYAEKSEEQSAEPFVESFAEPKIVVNDMSLSNIDNIDTAPVTEFPPPTDIIEPEGEKKGLIHYLNIGAIWCISGLILFLFILVMQYMAASIQ